MIRRPPRSTLFPYRRSSDLRHHSWSIHKTGRAPSSRGARFSGALGSRPTDRKSTRLNSSHPSISYAVFCLKKKTMLLRRYLCVLDRGFVVVVVKKFFIVVLC